MGGLSFPCRRIICRDPESIGINFLPAARPVFSEKRAGCLAFPETSSFVAFPASPCLTSFAMYPALQGIESKGIRPANINNFFMRIDFIIFV
jgi:hypothetical protein